MEACKPVLNTGLRGVTIASTKISDVKGAEGKLVYRGYRAKDLAGNTSFEEVVYLLLFERLPNSKELSDFKQQIDDQRMVPGEILSAMEAMPKDALPMDVLQATVPMMANYDPDIRQADIDSATRMAVRLTARFATIVAAWDRIRNGKAPIAPDPNLSQAANFLYMLNGEAPDDELASFFDACLVLHAEHSFNASTFAAREVASTKAHMYAAVAAGVGSLSGPLHGGANTRVMQMLLAIGDLEKVDDPRAHIIAPMSQTLGKRAGDTRWYDLSKALEVKGKAAFKKKKGKDIFVNVDFYSASLYYYMGIAVDLFSPIFAISRIAGWSAHVIEELYGGAAAKPTLYRPESDYVGDYCGPDECSFVPMDER